MSDKNSRMRVTNCPIDEINKDIFALGIKLKIANIPQNNRVEFVEFLDHDRMIHVYYFGFNYDQNGVCGVFVQMRMNKAFFHQSKSHIFIYHQEKLLCFDKRVVIEKMPTEFTPKNLIAW